MCRIGRNSFPIFIVTPGHSRGQAQVAWYSGLGHLANQKANILSILLHSGPLVLEYSTVLIDFCAWAHDFGEYDTGMYWTNLSYQNETSDNHLITDLIRHFSSFCPNPCPRQVILNRSGGRKGEGDEEKSKINRIFYLWLGRKFERKPSSHCQLVFREISAQPRKGRIISSSLQVLRSLR